VYCYLTCPLNEQLSSIKKAGGEVVGKIANKISRNNHQNSNSKLLFKIPNEFINL
jgi:hypothetical protein